MCVSDLGGKGKYLPRGLQRVIVVLSDMVQLECAESDASNREALAYRIGLTVAAVGAKNIRC
jgi:hypothetical protein